MKLLGRHVKGSWITAAGAAAVLLVGTGLAITVLDRADARLKVTVTGLPDGVQGEVTVVGPTTYAFTGKLDERGVRTGGYRLRVAPVSTPLGMAYPELDDTPIGQVPVGGTVAVTAEYAVVIPATTRILDHTNPGIVSLDGREVIFAADSPSLSHLVRGNVFVVAEGPQTPDPLARRVDAVRQTPAGTVVTTTPVLISEAMPSGRYRLDSSQIALRVLAPAAFSGVAGDSAQDPLVSVNFGEMMLKDKGCSFRGGKFAVDVHNLRPELSGSFDWGLFPPHVDVKVTATLNPQVTMRGDFSATSRCERKWQDQDGLRWLNTLCDKVVGRLARVGPVSLRCKAKPFLSVGLQSTGVTSFDFESTVTGGIKDNKPTLQLSERRMKSLSQQIYEADTANFSATADVGLEFGLHGTDPSGTAWLGLTFEVGFGPALTLTTPEASSEASITARIRLKAEARLDARFKDFTKGFNLAEIEKRFVLWPEGDPGSFRTVKQVPHKIPDGLRLPYESEEEGLEVFRDLDRPWVVSRDCTDRKTLPSDANRTDMRSADYGFGDVAAEWQLGVYKDIKSAFAAYKEILAAFRTCPDETWTAAKPVGVGDESWARHAFDGPGSQNGGSVTVTVVRSGNAIIVSYERWGPAQRSDVTTPPDPGDVAANRKIVAALCDAGFPC